MVGWLVVGSGRCGRGPDVDVARATSAADGHGHRREGQAALRAGAGPRYRSARLARMVAGGCGRSGRRPPGRRGRAWPGWPSGTGPPAADLMGVQATKALAGLEALLDGPAPPGDSNQGGQRHRAWHEAAVEGQLAGLAVAADQQPALPSLTARCRVASSRRMNAQS